MGLNKELEDILSLLSDEGKPLSASMLKLLMLSKKVGNEDFSKWIDAELRGYSPGTVPSYRKVSVTYHARVRDAYSIQDIRIPLPATASQNHPVYQSISQIEHLMSNGDQDVRGALPPEMIKMMGSFVQYAIILDGWVRVDKSELSGILMNLRVELLNKLVEIQSELPNEDAEDAHDIINNAMSDFLNNSHISAKILNINVGSPNSPVQQSLSHDFSQIQERLAAEDVSQEKIIELIEILRNEGKSSLASSFWKWANGVLGDSISSIAASQLGGWLIERIQELPY